MTAPTVNSTVIDAMVSIESIHVASRNRRELGDLQSLADSIADVGLLNPITMTRDSRLIAGQRRLEACRLLDWAAVPVRFVDSQDDAAKLLRTERDENTCRKDMLPSEVVALGRQIEDLERPKARERMAEAGRSAAPGRSAETHGTRTQPLSTNAVVGEALGVSASNYGRAKALVAAAEAGDEKAAEAVAQMDRTGRITPAYNQYKGRDTAPSGPTGARPDREPEPEPEPDEVPESDSEDWIPKGTEKGPRPAQRRRELIRELAPRGYTSGQIGELLGIRAGTIREIARGEDIEIVADTVVGRSRHSIDSNRIIRQTVQDLENLETSLNLIRFDRLDRGEIEYWTTSLSKSIRVLNRLNKQLKEIVQ